jgi:hypothetical protein
MSRPSGLGRRYAARRRLVSALSPSTSAPERDILSRSAGRGPRYERATKPRGRFNNRTISSEWPETKSRAARPKDTTFQLTWNSIKWPTGRHTHAQLAEKLHRTKRCPNCCCCNVADRCRYDRRDTTDHGFVDIVIFYGYVSIIMICELL